MSFIASLAAVGTAVAGTAGVAGLSTGTAALLGAGTLAAGGAALGAGTSAAMGGDPGEGALMGGIAAPLLVPSAMGAAGALGAGAAGGGAGAGIGRGGALGASGNAALGSALSAESLGLGAGGAGAGAGGALGGAGGALGASGTGAISSAITPGFASGVGATTGGAGLGGGAASGLGASMGATGAGSALPMGASMGGQGLASPGLLGTIGDFATAHPIITQAGTGAVLGAATNPNDPMKGALTGGIAGGIGGYGAEALGGMGGTIGEFATAHPVITGTGISMLAQPLVGSMMPSGPSAEDNLNAANASDREQYLRYLRAYRPSLSPGYAAGGITDLDGYMSNAQNIPNANEVADPEGYQTNSVKMMAGGGLSSLFPGGQDGADWLAKNSLPGMIFGWEGAHDIPLIGGMFNDPNTATLSPEEKKKLLEMAAAQGQPVPAQAMASGGIADLGGYRSGGSPNLLHGPGTGVSDDIPATIEGKQPARLASGEYVISSRIVSELGQGSTDAGAKVLDNMVNRINEGRSKTLGGKNYAKDTKAYKHLPA